MVDTGFLSCMAYELYWAVGGYNPGMKMICAIWLFTLVSCISVAQTRSKAADLRDKQNDLKQDRLRASGKAALQRVKDSMKVDRCAQYAGQSAADCMSIELKALERDERIYARAISGMLRIVSIDDLVRSPLRHALYKENLRAGPEFDDGDAAWRHYRQNICGSVADSEAGGSIERPAYFNCMVTLTQNHMLDLEGQYDILWH